MKGSFSKMSQASYAPWRPGSRHLAYRLSVKTGCIRPTMMSQSWGYNWHSRIYSHRNAKTEDWFVGKFRRKNLFFLQFCQLQLFSEICHIFLIILAKSFLRKLFDLFHCVIIGLKMVLSNCPTYLSTFPLAMAFMILSERFQKESFTQKCTSGAGPDRLHFWMKLWPLTTTSLLFIVPHLPGEGC